MMIKTSDKDIDEHVKVKKMSKFGIIWFKILTIYKNISVTPGLFS